MPDLRERVERERGLLKRIQLHVPGFAGYRRREDIRTADNMLRIQVANLIKDARRTVEQARRTMVDSYQMAELDVVGRLINSFQALEGKVRHAEGGYSGISPAIRIEEEELDRLYEYDLSLLEGAVSMGQEAAALRDVANNGSQVPEKVDKLRTMLKEFEDAFKKRMNVIAGMEVVE